ncbi:glutathione S-transferase 2-like [Dermacentor andersoni]|uniref:glutathione S-transferase 2-like n=1 Tax=Dermacentor andersoni TaxID=34620 RepID=UPI003B3BC189
MVATLYSVPASTSCIFVRSLARHIGFDLTVKHLDFTKNEHLAEDYLKLNPFHKVPTLDDGGFVVYESTAIAYYMLRKHAPECDLYPRSIELRTRVDQVLATVATTIQPKHFSFLRDTFCENLKPTEGNMAAYEEGVLKRLELLIGAGPFSLGDTLTLGDLFIVANLAVALNTAADPVKFPTLVDYYERVKVALPYFEEICEPAIAFIKERWAQLK